MNWRYMSVVWVLIVFGIGGWFLAEAARNGKFTGVDLVGWSIFGGAVGWGVFFGLKAVLEKGVSLGLHAADYRDWRLLAFYVIGAAIAFVVGYGLAREVVAGFFASFLATGVIYIVGTLFPASPTAARPAPAKKEEAGEAPKPPEGPARS